MQSMIHLLLLPALCSALLATPLASWQEQENVDANRAKQEADKAYEAYLAAERQAASIRTAAQALYKKARAQKKNSDKERASWLASYRRATNLVKAAEAGFRRRFEKTDWRAWKLPAEARQLETGLSAIGRDRIETKPGDSVLAFEYLLEKLPHCAAALNVKRVWLPIAYPSTGNMPRAIEGLRALIDKLPENEHPGIHVHIGDCYALMGKLTQAREAYQKAIALVPDVAMKRYDPRAKAKRNAVLRYATIGKKAAPLDALYWLGSEANTLAELAGKVILVDFWATWCQPCRQVMPGLDRYYEEHRRDGVTVLGVTRFYDHGFLALSAKQIHEGHPVKGMDQESFRSHLEAFRKNTAISYPFVVSKPKTFAAYHVSGIPTIFVIDRKGIVRFVAVGGAKEALLRIAVKQCMEH